jgi:excisionase family DNA binding protein
VNGAPERPRPFLTVKEAASELRLDESTLYRHLREDRFPGVKVGGRYLIPAAVIEELAADAIATGRCIEVDEWAIRRRDERAAAALAAGDTDVRRGRRDHR